MIRASPKDTEVSAATTVENRHPVPAGAWSLISDRERGPSTRASDPGIYRCTANAARTGAAMVESLGIRPHGPPARDEEI